MADAAAGGRGGWAYVSLVSSLPGRSPDPRRALALQFVSFEVVAVVLAAWYDLWSAVPLATAAIAIATAGSGLMVALSDRIQRLAPAPAYRRTLFETGFDVVMGLVAFVALVTYLLVSGREAGGGPIVGYFDDGLPVLAVAFGLFVAWDLCYRIGTAWWVSITGLWRSVAYGPGLDRRTRRAYVRIDLLTMAFAALQLLLLPFVWADRVLAVAVLGHVGAVVIVSGAAAGLLVRR